MTFLTPARLHNLCSFALTVCSAIFLLFLSSSSPASALEVDLSSAAKTLNVGEDLVVSWTAGPVEVEVEVRLLDDSGAVIASLRTLTDESGKMPPQLLWAQTGITGCHTEEVPKPFDFEYYDAAEAALIDRAFGIDVVEAETGSLLGSTEITFVALDELYFFSDGLGRPCSEFRGRDNMYLSGRNNLPFTHPVRFFLVSAGDELEVRGPLKDVRNGYRNGPQIMPAAPSGLPVVLDIILPQWTANIEGCFRGIVRLETDDRRELMQRDRVAESPPFSDHGSTNAGAGSQGAGSQGGGSANLWMVSSGGVVVYPYPKAGPPCEL